MPGKFHVHSGFTFQRADNGAVAFSHHERLIAVFDKDAWVSIVTEMSSNPGAEAHTAAAQLHIGENE